MEKKEIEHGKGSLQEIERRLTACEQRLHILERQAQNKESATATAYEKNWYLPSSVIMNVIISGIIVFCFFSLYIMHVLYGYMSFGAAIAVCLGLTSLSAALALQYNSMYIALVGLAGSCLAPLAMPIYIPNIFALYLTILALIFSCIGAYKRWHWLSLGCLVSVSYYYIFYLAGALSGIESSLFLILYFYIFNIPYYCGLRSKYSSTYWEAVIVLVSGIFSVWAWYQTSLVRFNTMPTLTLLAYITILSGVFYLLYIWRLYYKNKENTILLNTMFLLMAGCLFAACIAQWPGYEQSIVLYLVGFVFFISSIGMQEPFIRRGAYVFWAYASIHMLHVLYLQKTPAHWVLNSINLAVFVGVLVFCIAAYCFKYIHRFATHEQIWALKALYSGAILTLFYWFMTPLWQYPYHSIGFIFYALLLFVIGAKHAILLFRKFAYGVGCWALGSFVVYCITHNVVHPHYMYSLNAIYAIMVLSLVVAQIYRVRYKKNITAVEDSLLYKVISVGIIVCIYVWVRSNIIILFDRASQQPGFLLTRLLGDYQTSSGELIRTHFTDMLLTGYYFIYAGIVIALALRYKDAWVQRIGLVLLWIALGKLSTIIFGITEPLQKTIAFAVVGILFVLGGYIYQRVIQKK